MDPGSCIPYLHEEELLNGDVFLWDIPFSSEPDNNFINSMLEEEPILLTSSAFVKYIKPNHHSSPTIIITDQDSGTTNVHHRLIHMLRGIHKAQLENNEKMMYKKNKCGRGFRHMMRERQRREKLSKSYADLHSMLPHCSKTDKISILQSATAYVKDCKMVKEELLKRNMQLTNALEVMKGNKEGQTIRICIVDHTNCALDSMIGAVRRLKEMNVQAMSIQTPFLDNERISIVNIETRMGKI